MTHPSLRLTAPESLPDAIWMPSGSDLAIYRGSPLEMVRSMAAEMGDDITVRDAVRHLVGGLLESRQILLRLDYRKSEDELAKSFVGLLVLSGVGRPIPQA